MDPVFDAQYLPMRNLFLREGTEIEVAYTPDGEVDYIYVVGQLLARRRNVERLQQTLPGLRPVERTDLGDLGDRPVPGDLVVLSIDALEGRRLTVPEALDRLDQSLGDANPALHGEEPLATPVHIMHTSKLCAASEPAVPCESPPRPCPPPKAGEGRYPVRLGVCDTGLVRNLNLGLCPCGWAASRGMWIHWGRSCRVNCQTSRMTAGTGPLWRAWHDAWHPEPPCMSAITSPSPAENWST